MDSQLSLSEYKEIFYNSQAPMLIISTDAPAYTMIDVNNAYLSATNTSREDLIGKSVFGVFPANPTDNDSKNIERTIYSFEQAIKNKQPHTMYDYRYDIPIPGTHDFEERYWTTSNTPVLDEKGEVKYFIHSPSNVTDFYRLNEREKATMSALKEQRQQLEDSEQLLRNVTTATPTGLWMSDSKGSVTYINQTWVDWTGRSYEQNLGRGWLIAIVQEDRQRVAEKLIQDVNENKNFESEFRLNHKDGTIHWCIVNGQPQYKNDGSFTGYIGACVDITDQKQLQQQKDDFIGIASHELKTPVTTIKGYAQILEKMLMKKGDVKEAEMMRRMDTQVRRLTNLIGDLLDVTKINSGKLQFNDTEFDFNPMVEELLEDLQRTTETHTLVQEFKETGIVFGDKERIGQVIANLITNAIKYSPENGKITIRTGKENNEVTLCVEDCGVGIPADKLERVFEQFYRVSGDMQHTFPGLGLGLYISSEIIKREGGRIWVNSTEGEGSTFCFALPLLK